MKKDNTGKLVFGFGGTVDLTPCIYRDNGWYEDTILEYNVRKVETIELYEGLWGGDNTIQKIMSNGSYGIRWGGGQSGLFEITEEQITALRAENTKELKIKKEKTEAYEKRQAEKYAELVNAYKDICPKCGTWCYGDCES